MRSQSNTSRSEFFGGLAELVGRAEGVNHLNPEEKIRLAHTRAHLESQGADNQPLQNEKIVTPAEASVFAAHFKILLLAQMLGTRDRGRQQISGTTMSDLRARQDLTHRIATGYFDEYPNHIAELAHEVRFFNGSVPHNTVDERRRVLPGTNTELTTHLTGVRQQGFRPVDPRVAVHIAQVVEQMEQRYCVSAALNQSAVPFTFPSGLDIYAKKKLSLPDGITRFGKACFRSSEKADASIVKAWPEVGHFAAIAGAGFGQLIEVDENGGLKQHANIFMGPNNMLGGENSVLECTLKAGGFDLSKTFLVVEHQECDDLYALDLPTDLQRRAGDVPKSMSRNAQWLNRAEERYGVEDSKKIVSGELARLLPRQGKQRFNLAAMIELEAHRCGLPDNHVIVDETCPAMGKKGPNGEYAAGGILRHFSNTVETAFFPNTGFVSPDKPLPADSNLLWPRNGYFTFAK